MKIRLLSGIGVEISYDKQVLVMEPDSNYENAQIFTCSHQVPEGEIKAQVFNWPGEYEVKGWMIQGYELIPNVVVYKLRLENMTILHLGKVTDFPENLVDQMGDIDVLILPVTSEGMTPHRAKKIADRIDPRLIIPVGDLRINYMEQYGSVSEALPSLNLSRSNLPNDKTEIINLLDA